MDSRLISDGRRADRFLLQNLIIALCGAKAVHSTMSVIMSVPEIDVDRNVDPSPLRLPRAHGSADQVATPGTPRSLVQNLVAGVDKEASHRARGQS